MKFQYFSDLHIEHNKDLFKIFSSGKLLKKSEGVTIFAGDIYYEKRR